MWTIANEYEISGISADQVAQAAAHLVAAERKLGVTKRLPVSVPVSFGLFGGDTAGAVKTKEVMAAFGQQAGLPSNFVSSRFIAATNPQNPGSFVKNWLPEFKREIPDTPLWLSEMGTGVLLSCTGESSGCTPSEAQQAKFNAEQFEAAPPGAEDILLGGAQFEFIDEPWKGPAQTTNDATFGVLKYAAPPDFRTVPTQAPPPGPANGTYRVDQLAKKPSWTSLRRAFKGRPDPEVTLSGSQSDHPDIRIEVEAGGSHGAPIRKVKVRLPKHLRTRKRSLFRKGTRGARDGDALRRAALDPTKRRLTVEVGRRGARELTIRVRRRALKRVRKINKGKLPRFPITVTDVDGRKTKHGPRASLPLRRLERPNRPRR